MVQTYNILTAEQRAHFLAHGYIHLPSAIPRANVDRFTQNMWTRLGWDSEDKATWEDETVHMPRHREAAMRDFMPVAYQAACESPIILFRVMFSIYGLCLA